MATVAIVLAVLFLDFVFAICVGSLMSTKDEYVAHRPMWQAPTASADVLDVINEWKRSR